MYNNQLTQDFNIVKFKALGERSKMIRESSMT